VSSVTDETANTRVAFPSRNEWGRRARWDASYCGECGRAIGVDEPVYLHYVNANGGRCGNRITPCCIACVTAFLSPLSLSYLEVRAAAPCEACGLEVHFCAGAWWHAHVACSQRCRKTLWRRPTRRAKDRPCNACGIEFTPKRSDARYCTPACKQRAYRERNR
jgi:hypothetical protein